MTRRKLNILLAIVLALYALAVSWPFMPDKFAVGHDFGFHIARIEAIKQEIESWEPEVINILVNKYIELLYISHKQFTLSVYMDTFSSGRNKEAVSRLSILRLTATLNLAFSLDYNNRFK